MKKFVVVLLALVMALSFSVVSAKDYQVAMISDTASYTDTPRSAV